MWTPPVRSSRPGSVSRPTRTSVLSTTVCMPTTTSSTQRCVRRSRRWQGWSSLASSRRVLASAGDGEADLGERAAERQGGGGDDLLGALRADEAGAAQLEIAEQRGDGFDDLVAAVAGERDASGEAEPAAGIQLHTAQRRLDSGDTAEGAAHQPLCHGQPDGPRRLLDHLAHGDGDELPLRVGEPVGGDRNGLALRADA